MKLLRPYRKGEEVEVGDVVQSFEGAFSTSIVTKIDKESVWLARPMAQVDHFAGSAGSVWIHYENYSAPRLAFEAHFRVYTRGASGERDNRRRNY